MHGGSGLPARHRRSGAWWPTALSALVVLAVVLGGGGYVLLARASSAGHTGPSQLPQAGRPRASHLPQAGRPSPGPGPAAGARPRATVSITWVGDMTFGMLNSWPPAGTGSLLDNVRRYLHGGLTVGNLESVLGNLPMTKCTPGEASCYQFEAPAYTAVDLRRDGFAAVNVANNHTLDAGAAGEASTDAALHAAGLLWAGRPGQITYLTRNGIKIALLGFAPWSYDADALDIQAAAALVRTAKRHAQLVIVMEHLGGEGPGYRHVKPGEEYFLGQDRGDSIAFTHSMIDAGADLVMGSGPHVLRGMQWYHHHLIAYSVGNFCGYNTLGLDEYTSVSAILHVTLTASGGFVRGSLTPLLAGRAGSPGARSGRDGYRLRQHTVAAGLCRERARPPLCGRHYRTAAGLTASRAAPSGWLRPVLMTIARPAICWTAMAAATHNGATAGITKRTSNKIAAGAARRVMPVSHGSSAGPPIRRQLMMTPAKPASVMRPSSGPDRTTYR